MSQSRADGYHRAAAYQISRYVSYIIKMNSTINIPEVMKTGLANLNILCNFSQFPLSNFSLLTVFFTAYVDFFRFFLNLLSG